MNQPLTTHQSHTHQPNTCQATTISPKEPKQNQHLHREPSFLCHLNIITKQHQKKKLVQWCLLRSKKRRSYFHTASPSWFCNSRHITYVIVPKVLLLSVLLKEIPAFKQASSAQIIILPHFKTRGRVFSNQRSMMRHSLLHIVFWISILNFEFLIFEFSFYCG